MQSGYNLDLETRQRHRRLWALTLGAVILAVGFLLGRLGLGDVPPDDPRWELVIASRLTLHKAVVAPALVALAFLTGNGLWWAFDRLPVARRLSYFVTREDGQPAETPSERAARLSNAGRVYVTLLLGAFLLAAAVVAR